MTEKDFFPQAYPPFLEAFTVSAEAPSNIALIKYWGKKDGQIPANPSLSLTLSQAKTLTKLQFKHIEKADFFSFEVYFEGLSNTPFRPKIAQFLEKAEPYLPFLKHYHLVIDTRNTFPHSSGIASSASGMAALAMCLTELERNMLGGLRDEKFWNKTAFLARLGSGSATRSLKGPVMLWGENQSDRVANDLFGTQPSFEIHPEFNQICDSILLVETGQKQVSSTVGHSLMHGHPFAEKRFQQANGHLTLLKTALQTGNWETFIKITESEALSLHAMMMTSHPYFVLMQPETLSIIKKIWHFREQSPSRLCFTLDAGANVHLLYHPEEQDNMRKFINQQLLQHCQGKACLHDITGLGAKINETDNNL